MYILYVLYILVGPIVLPGSCIVLQGVIKGGATHVIDPRAPFLLIKHVCLVARPSVVWITRRCEFFTTVLVSYVMSKLKVE